MALTFIDRSRWEKFHQHCPRACWWQYYAGRTRHGIRQKSESLPLATGTILHEILANILSNDHIATIAFTRTTIRQGIEDYRELITQRGFDLAARVGPSASSSSSSMSAEDAWALGIPTESEEDVRQREILHTIAEQSALIEGLAWVFVLYVLPQIVEEYEIVSVEQEEGFVLPETCSCGLTDAIVSWEAHQARDCHGVYVMTRPDLLLRRRSTGQLEYHEFKTAAQVTKDSKEQWEHRPQFLLGCRAIEKRLGEPVVGAAVHHFIKGSRKADYSQESGGYTGPKRQQSFLCYLYHREGVPPFVHEDWAPRWTWIDEDGKSRRLGKGWQKEPVWTQTFPQLPAGMSPVEYWVRFLSPNDLASCYELTGPIGRQAFMETDVLQAMGSWAGRIRNDVDYLHNPPAAVTPADYRQDLNGCFPQSWDCHPYGSGVCEFLPICTGANPVTPGGDPVEQIPDRYVYRAPHHQQELLSAQQQGWLSLGTTTPRNQGADDSED